MALKYGTAYRNARLDVLESTIGASPILRILTGSPPATPATAQTGTILAEITLPSNWMADASGGVKNMTGSWNGTAGNTGTAGYFRILNSAGTVVHIQGTAAVSGADMILDSASFATGQAFAVLTFSITAPGA
jgi:hypothetical protein